MTVRFCMTDQKIQFLYTELHADIVLQLKKTPVYGYFFVQQKLYPLGCRIACKPPAWPDLTCLMILSPPAWIPETMEPSHRPLYSPWEKRIAARGRLSCVALMAFTSSVILSSPLTEWKARRVSESNPSADTFTFVGWGWKRVREREGERERERELRAWDVFLKFLFIVH